MPSLDLGRFLYAGLQIHEALSRHDRIDPNAWGLSVYQQGCHWSGKSQGNSRSGKSQGILEFVREIWNFVESQGNSRKVREISENLYFIRGCGDQLASPKISARAFGARIIFFDTSF